MSMPCSTAVALAETCDRHPSARAAHIASKVIDDDSLLLTFCGHCTTVNADALVDSDWLIYDVTQV